MARGRGRQRSSASKSASHSQSSSSRSRSWARPRKHKRKRIERSPTSDSEVEYHKIAKTSDSGKSITTKSDSNRHYLSEKGRMYGRYLDMWGPVSAVLDHGFSRDPNEDKGFYTEQQNAQYRTYCDLIKLVPQLVDDLHKQGNQGNSVLANYIDRGRKAACRTDTGGFRANIHRWRKFEPPFPEEHRNRGFYHQTCGFLLCPASMEWGDYNVRQGLRDGVIKAAPDDFPRFLWQGERVKDDLFDGWLQNDLIVKGYLHIFRGPSAALSGGRKDPRGRKCNAALHGIKHVNITSIAYVCTLLRLVLSDQGTFSAEGRWPHDKLYKEIITCTNNLPRERRDVLLDWWDQQVFSDVLDDPSDEDDSMDSQPGHTSMAARMQQQLGDMAALADVPSSKRDRVKKGRRPGRVEET